MSQFIPVPKIVTPNDLGEFRSISLLNIFSKMFKKILKGKILIFKHKNDLLTSNQIGFITDSATELAVSVTTIYDRFLENLDKKLKAIHVPYFLISKRLLTLQITRFF